MRIDKLGEFGLIKRYSRLMKTDSSVIKGSGDDCAVMKWDKNRYLLFTCDMLVEGVDFSLQENPYLVGRKAIAVSLSDIAACAGWPRYCLISLGIARRTSLKSLDRLMKGMLDIARRYKINLVGGDLSRARQLVIDVSTIGEVEKKKLALRSGAQNRDIIFVSGELGGSIHGKHLKFIPRLKEARFLVENFRINSMLDISDGLSQDLGHILKESKAGALLYADLIPLSKEASGLKDALYTGEDFELLFTMSPKEARRLCALGLKDFRPIGEIRQKNYGLRLIDKSGREKVIPDRGFRHF